MSGAAVTWPRAIRVLHWGMAALIAGMALAGLVMVHGGLEIGTRFALYQWHKSFGLLVLALVMVRLVTRLLTRRPPPHGSPAAIRLARLGHTLLYGAMIALPLSGWFLASASPFRVPTWVFGLVRLPSLTGPDAATEALAKTAHLGLAIALAVLVAGHVLMALKHHLVDGDGLLGRMGWKM
jgi:cytochrome b561